MECSKYNSERNILRDRIYELGQGWSLEGILGIIEKTREYCKALFAFLKDTGLGCKICYFINVITVSIIIIIIIISIISIISIIIIIIILCKTLMLHTPVQ